MHFSKALLIAVSLYGTYRVLQYLWFKESINTTNKSTLAYKTTWTKREISQYTGKDGGPILIALNRKVFDVSMGRGFYGPEGAYHVFAGRDASRLLATQSFDDGITEEELEAPIDTLEDLTEDDWEGLNSYVGLYSVKYQCVGELIE